MSSSTKNFSSPLSFADALQSPCDHCKVSCCSYLPLHDMTISTLVELDYLLYISNFENMELALVQGTTWRIHYRARCTRLLENNRCQLHGTDAKPRVCRAYNSYKCFYKPMFEQEESDQFLRFNRERLEAFASMLQFDENRNIIAMPSMAEIRANLPPLVIHDSPIVPTVPNGNSTQSKTYKEFAKPCYNCPSWCCSVLSFPLQGIFTVANLDYLWFCLGFPNVEIGIGAEGWSVNVRTFCRHFTKTDASPAGKCSIYGQSNRPIQCVQYDELQCAYKGQYGSANGPTVVHIHQEDFSRLAEMYQFDHSGNVQYQPSVQDIYQHLRMG